MTGSITLLGRPWQLAFVGLAFAAMALVVSSTDLVPAVAAACAVVGGALILKRPELGALSILVAVAVVPRGTLFEWGLPLAGGNAKVTDLLLAATLASWLAGRVLRPDRYRLPSTTTVVLLLGVLALALIGLATAHGRGSPLKLGLLELRPLLSYLLVFPLVSGIRSARDFRLGLGAVLLAAATSAVVTIVRYVQGAGDLATFSDGAFRITDTVFLYQLLGLIWCAVGLAYSSSARIRRVLLVLMVLQLAGLFVTFQRGAWIAAIIAAPVVYLLLPRRRRRRLVSWSLPVVVIAAVGIVAVNSLSEKGVSDPLAAGLRRLSSLGSYQRDVSSRYRVAEWTRAAEEIQAQPIGGIGLGSSITFVNPMYSPEYDTNGFTFSTYYIHNSYVWFALKLGVIGALLFFALIVRAFVMALRSYRTPRGPTLHAIAVGVLASLVALGVLAASGPHFNDDNATPAVAALIALAEVTRLGFQATRKGNPGAATRMRPSVARG
jgi:O-antigen ligase